MPRCCSKSAAARSASSRPRAVGAGTAPTDAELADLLQPQRRALHRARAPRRPLRARSRPRWSKAQRDADRGRDRRRPIRPTAPNTPPTEKRTITQVVVADQAGADGARRQGEGRHGDRRRRPRRRARSLDADRRRQGRPTPAPTSAAIADAVVRRRAAARSSARSAAPLGWTVARVDAVEQVAGKTLGQARAEIVAALDEAARPPRRWPTLHDTIDDALAEQRDLRRGRSPTRS